MRLSLPATSAPRARRTRAYLAGALGIVATLSFALAACGSSSTAGSSTSCNAPASWHLVKSCTLTIASDTTYAPAEFQDPQNPTHYIGYDMDLARELGKRLNLTVSIQKATFDAIIPDISTAPLGQQRYDLSISSFTITDARKAKVNMIPYLQAGESILVQTGNPHNVKTFADMCGKQIAVQKGTIEESEINDANGVGDKSSGQAPICANNKINKLAYDDQTVVVQQVLNGRADASYQDQPVTGYYISLHKSQLQTGGVTVSPSPEGIVIRKDNPDLQTAVTNAISAMQKDGTYNKILTTWGAQDLALSAQS